MKKFLFLLIVSMILPMSGCSTAEQSQKPWQISMQSSMGGKSPDVQEYKCKLTITYTGKNQLAKVNAQLDINDLFKDRIVQNIKSNKIDTLTCELEEVFFINTKGLSKEQIQELGLVVKGVNITWTEGGQEHEYYKDFQQ